MRKFKLINSLGAEFDLMRKDAFLNVPSGMGFSSENSYARIGGSFLPTLEQSAQKVVTGEMVFAGYEQYEEFARFISYKPLKLVYMPRTTWLYLDGQVTRLDKGEISYTTSRLHCAIDFTGVSKWYVPKTILRAETDLTDAKVYSYSYPPSGYIYKATKIGSIQIENYGTDDAPCVLTIIGPTTNPKWALVVNGEPITSGALIGTIDATHKLVVDSNDTSMRIVECETSTNTVTRNLYQDVDHSLDNFLYAPRGISTLVVDSDDYVAIPAYIEVDEINETL